jgi:hypothetical protein
VYPMVNLIASGAMLVILTSLAVILFRRARAG